MIIIILILLYFSGKKKSMHTKQVFENKPVLLFVHTEDCKGCFSTVTPLWSPMITYVGSPEANSKKQTRFRMVIASIVLRVCGFVQPESISATEPNWSASTVQPALMPAMPSWRGFISPKDWYGMPVRTILQTMNQHGLQGEWLCIQLYCCCL